MTADSPQPSSADDRAPRKRGRWQFGLSTLLLVVTACAFVSWWYAQESWEAFQERFTKRIEKLGGYIEWGNAESPTRISFRYWGLSVDPKKKALTNEQLGRLRRDLDRLGPFTLNLSGSPNARGAITDAGLEHLEGLRGLECLCLRHTNVTDTGVERLGRIKGLQFADLRDTKVTERTRGGMSRSDLIVCREDWQPNSGTSSSTKWKPPIPTFFAELSAAGLEVGYCSLQIQSNETGEKPVVDLPRNDVFMHDPVWEAFAPPLGVDHSKYRHDAGGALVVFDGVDELPRSEAGAAPRDMLLSGLADAIPVWRAAGNRVLAISRPSGLSPEEVTSLHLPHVPIGDLPKDLQDLLVERWFAIREGVAEHGRKLAKKMRGDLSGKKELQELAANPLFLTAMCVIYGEDKELPQDKRELYDRITETVLHSHLHHDPNVIEPARRRLEAIAYGMRTGEHLDPPDDLRKGEVDPNRWTKKRGVLVKGYLVLTQAPLGGVNASFAACLRAFVLPGRQR